MATILVGPFTSAQKTRIKEQSIVRRNYVQKALEWLSCNNIYYVDIDIKAQIANDVICIDKSGVECESRCPSMESNYKYTGKRLKMWRNILLCKSNEKSNVS